MMVPALSSDDEMEPKNRLLIQTETTPMQSSQVQKRYTKRVDNHTPNYSKRHSGGALFLIEQTIKNSLVQNLSQNSDLLRSNSSSAINITDTACVNVHDKSKSKSDLHLFNSLSESYNINFVTPDGGYKMCDNRTRRHNIAEPANSTNETRLQHPGQSNETEVVFSDINLNVPSTNLNEVTSTNTKSDNQSSSYTNGNQLVAEDSSDPLLYMNKYSTPNTSQLGPVGSHPSSPSSTVSEVTMGMTSCDLSRSCNQLRQDVDLNNIKIPIVGYEVMEERARFTVYKLRVLTGTSGESWLVLRRYTDFVRLFNRLRTDFPNVHLPLPRKKWFGDNFKRQFLQDRVQGLQNFVNSLLSHSTLLECKAVKEFFCLNEPPLYSEIMEDGRALFEAQDETILQLRKELRSRDVTISELQTQLTQELFRNQQMNELLQNIRSSCPNCSMGTNNQTTSDEVSSTNTIDAKSKTVLETKPHFHLRSTRQTTGKHIQIDI